MQSRNYRPHLVGAKMVHEGIPGNRAGMAKMLKDGGETESSSVD